MIRPTAAFYLVRNKADRGIEMLREILSKEQEGYYDALGRYWEGPLNPIDIPIDGVSEKFEPNRAEPGCPSWREMGLPRMMVPFSFSCERHQDFHRQLFEYALGVAFLWTGVDHTRPGDEVSLVARFLRFDGGEWSDSSWRVYGTEMVDDTAYYERGNGVPLHEVISPTHHGKHP